MKTFRPFLFSIITIILALTVFFQTAQAHALDTDLVVQSARVGPYELSIWCFSSAMDAVSMHIASALNDPQTGAPVMGAQVIYHVESLPEGKKLSATQAGQAVPTNGFLFESDIPLERTGSYRVTVDVSDANKLGGTFVFVTTVYPVSTWTQGLIILLLIVGIGAMLWLLREGFFILRKRRLS